MTSSAPTRSSGASGRPLRCVVSGACWRPRRASPRPPLTLTRSPVAGAPRERLTSHLRALICITAFGFALKPRAVPSAEDRYPGTPRLVLHIRAWSVVAGDRHEPVFFPRAHELATAPADAAVRHVLKKWWCGE